MKDEPEFHEEPVADLPEESSPPPEPQFTGTGAPGVDSPVPDSIEEMGGQIWMRHPEVESDPVSTTRMQLDDVWAPRGWIETDAPVEEEL